MSVIVFREGRAKVIAREWGTKAAIAAGFRGEDRNAYVSEVVQYFAQAEREEQARRGRPKK